MSTAVRHTAAAHIMSRHLDAGLSLRDAVNLTRADMRAQNCELAPDAYDHVKAAICEAIERAEVSCTDSSTPSTSAQEAQSAA